MTGESRVIIANITWNDSGWRNIYTDPRAGHKYAREHPGHESLNFKFDKKGLDDEQNIYGFVQWTTPPKNFAKNGIIIFYSKNLENHQGEIVGIYGDAQILKSKTKTKWKGFEKDELESTIIAKKDLSLLFPVPLNSEEYSEGRRLVPQVGYTYKDIKFAEEIILDEIKELKKTGIKFDEFKKLKAIYEFLTGMAYSEENSFEDEDIKEQDELLPLIKIHQSRDEIINELKTIEPTTPQLVEFRGKQYKRNNKSIAGLKILRDFKCQMCNVSILKKDGSLYVEAAHITEKRHKGPEAYDNILILCPNHHKEFDLGKRVIIERTKDKIIFELNDKKYELSLELK